MGNKKCDDENQLKECMRLLMLQEKTNYPHGQLFQNLLRKLKESDDIFSILQTATLKKLK